MPRLLRITLQFITFKPAIISSSMKLRTWITEAVNAKVFYIPQKLECQRWQMKICLTASHFQQFLGSGMWVLALACYCPRNSALFLICLSPGLLGVLLLNLTILNLYQIVFLKDVFVDYKHVYHLVSLHLAMRDFTQPQGNIPTLYPQYPLGP